MHRIYAGAAKFPAFITPKVVAYAMERGVTVSCIAEQESSSVIETARRKFSAKYLTPYRAPRGRFSTDAASRHVYAGECIVTGRIALMQNERVRAGEAAAEEAGNATVTG